MTTNKEEDQARPWEQEQQLARDRYFLASATVLAERLFLQGFTAPGKDYPGDETRKIIAQFLWDMVKHTIISLWVHLDAESDLDPTDVPDPVGWTSGIAWTPSSLVVYDPERDRDTQFLGFARLVALQLCRHESIPPGWLWLHAPEEEVLTVLARCAYDFLVHSDYHTSFFSSLAESRRRVLLVPDMTKWLPVASPPPPPPPLVRDTYTDEGTGIVLSVERDGSDHPRIHCTLPPRPITFSKEQRNAAILRLRQRAGLLSENEGEEETPV